MVVVPRVLEGLWHKFKKPPSGKSWLPLWRQATVRHLDDDYCLRGSLENDAELSHLWVTHWTTDWNCKRSFRSELIEVATKGLSEEHRKQALDAVDPRVTNAMKFVRALVGTSVVAFRSLLSNTRLERVRTAPLQRQPDDVWEAFAELAAENGMDVVDIAETMMTGLSRFEEVPEKFDRSIALWSSVAASSRLTSRSIAAIALERVNRDREAWHEFEKRRLL